MDNVLNRPLFRHREARNRLNDIAGVQRFEVGGPVQGFQPGGEVRPEGLPSIMEILQAGSLGRNMPMVAGQVTNLPEVERPLTAREKEAAETGSSMRSFIDRGAGAISSLGMGGYGALTDALSPAFATLGATSLAAELERQSDIAYNIALSNLTKGFSATEGMSPSDFDLEPADFDFAVARAKADAQQGKFTPAGPRTETATPGDRQAPMAYASPAELAALKPTTPRTGLGTPGDRQGPMAYSSPEEVAAVAEAATGPSTMEADARGRGPMIADPAAVAAGLNAEDIEVREKTLVDFMKEYSDAAPKYEGMDKNLLLAQIGFAIAAGESPNAMQNIANGLLAGSDMMLKDKAAKDEFNRQIQLAAMQYGFGEVSKDRQLERQTTDYVASRKVTYRGKKYGPNESIPVLHSDIINGRMPDGVVSESMNEAMLSTDATIREALLEARKNQTLSAEQYRETVTQIDKAASDFSMARNTIPLIEASIIRNADGEVTGLKPALATAVNKAANALNIKLEGLDSAEAYNSAMQTVSARMVQDILGEAGNNISNVDRELVAGIVGVAAGGYGNIFKDPVVLNSKLQEILQQAESKQQSALDTYKTLMEGFGNTYTPSGTPFRSMKAERVFAPTEPVQGFEYSIDENTGKYVKRYLDGGN
jgi:hypothetical protein